MPTRSVARSERPRRADRGRHTATDLPISRLDVLDHAGSEGLLEPCDASPGGAHIECESWSSYVPDSELATPIEDPDPPQQGNETDDTGDETDG
jgi:hypothetical protein